MCVITHYIYWGKDGNVTSAGWQVTLCDPIWHVSSRSGETSCSLLYSIYLTFLPLPNQLLLYCNTHLRKPSKWVIHILFSNQLLLYSNTRLRKPLFEWYLWRLLATEIRANTRRQRACSMMHSVYERRRLEPITLPWALNSSLLLPAFLNEQCAVFVWQNLLYVCLHVSYWLTVGSAVLWS